MTDKIALRSPGEGRAAVCTTCAGSIVTVIDTRMRADGAIRRRRACEQCRSRWTTIEIRVQDDDQRERDLIAAGIGHA